MMTMIRFGEWLLVREGVEILFSSPLGVKDLRCGAYNIILIHCELLIFLNVTNLNLDCTFKNTITNNRYTVVITYLPIVTL